MGTEDLTPFKKTKESKSAFGIDSKMFLFFVRK